MPDVQRLLVLARGGDRVAAEDLWVEAERTHDAHLTAAAARALGDPVRGGQAAAAFWDAGDYAALEQCCASWGLVVDRDRVERLDTLLHEAHGRRRVRLLSRADVLTTAFAARHSTEPFVYRHAGLRRGGADTTVCLAVPLPDEPDGSQTLVLGIRKAAGSASDPGRAWPRQLRPWRQDAARNAERLQSWARQRATDRLRLRMRSAEVDAVPELVDGEPPPQPGPDERMASLLSGPPTEQAFKDLVRVLDDWPAGSRFEALELARAVLDGWPDRVRVLTRRSFQRIARGRTLRATDDLYRHLRLGEVTVDDFEAVAGFEPLVTLPVTHLQLDTGELNVLPRGGLEALARSRFLRRVRSLSLSSGPRGLPSLRPLFEADTLPELRELDLSSCQMHLDADDIGDARLLRNVEVLRFQHNGALDAPTLTADAARALFRSPHVASLHTVSLPPRVAWATEVFEAVATSPTLDGLRRLDVSNMDLRSVSHAAFETLARHPLEVLQGRQCAVRDDAIAQLLRGHVGQTLTRLELVSNASGDALCQSLCSARHLEVVVLRPWHGAGPADTDHIGPEGAEALASSPWLPGAWHLDLRDQDLDDDSLERLLGALDTPRLEHLDLANNLIGPHGARALADNSALAALRELHLGGNPIDDEGFTALVTSPHLANLRVLDVSECNISQVGARALAGASTLPALRELRLAANDLGNEGAAHLAAAPSLARLERITLQHNGIGRQGIDALASSRWLAGRFEGLPGFAGAR